jgi:hypothetical protein
MVRKGFDLGQRRREQSGLPEERASFLSFVFPVIAALLLLADLITIPIVCADFFARGNVTFFGVSIASLGAVAVM